MDCTWNAPGLNAYQGSVAAAVARYGYPRDVQDRLAARAKRFDFDFLIEVKRDSVVGNGSAWLPAVVHVGQQPCASVADHAVALDLDQEVELESLGAGGEPVLHIAGVAVAGNSGGDAALVGIQAGGVPGAVHVRLSAWTAQATSMQRNRPQE